MLQGLFIPAYVLDEHYRKSLELGDADKISAFQAMLLKHETGAARIQQARSDYLSEASTKADAKVAITP